MQKSVGNVLEKRLRMYMDCYKQRLAICSQHFPRISFKYAWQNQVYKRSMFHQDPSDRIIGKVLSNHRQKRLQYTAITKNLWHLAKKWHYFSVSYFLNSEQASAEIFTKKKQ
jgi:PIN domain nuclease of toxin-antitoxin system